MHFQEMSSTINRPLAFQIKNLSCRYPNSESDVLEISNLDIPSGSMTFIVGSSGVGKSTILETLGLMNNTAVLSTDSIFNFYPLKEENPIELGSIWKESEGYLSQFRNSHLSFIFQNTNLFPTLSANENAIVSLVLQGEEKSLAIEKSRKLFREILPELKGDRSISELSGGQRQRLAFIRAMISNFTVLLADEPTGNLDLANAKALINNIKMQLDDRTAIIVSHDISLAMEFADQIVLIKKIKVNVTGKSKGNISNDTIYFRKDQNLWIKNEKPISSEDVFFDLMQSIQINEA